jgi:hypothetical protein
MKINIYDGVGVPPVEEPLNLRLIRDGKAVYVIAVNEQGELKDRGYLIGFSPDGTVIRSSGVSEKLGLRLDNLKRIVTTG